MRIETNQQSMFQRIDANSDGKITKDEMKAGAPKAPAGADAALRRVGGSRVQGPSLDELFSRVDGDGDGAITADENEAFMQAQDAERRGRRDPATMATNVFRKADGDGKITKSELAGVLPKGAEDSMIDKLFSDADGDEDGAITESELRTALEARLQHGRAYDAGGHATIISEFTSTRSFTA